MPSFDVEPERITVFPIDDEYWFSHYFERTDLFERLREYYNDDAYRFEIPTTEFETVRDELADEYIELEVVEDLELYCVVKDRTEPYVDTLRDAVPHWERADHRFFLLPDELAVKEAVERGTTRLTEPDLVLEL